jgi:hypothetical protein
MSLSQRIKLLTQRATITTATTTANWNSGVATSGLAGGDLFTVGVAGRWWRAQEAYFQLGAFNAAAKGLVKCG